MSLTDLDVNMHSSKGEKMKEQSKKKARIFPVVQEPKLHTRCAHLKIPIMEEKVLKGFDLPSNS